jgi:hypothetical protein
VLETGENHEYGKNIAERMYISWLMPEYNETGGGDGLLGFKHSEKTKNKQRERMLGNKFSLGLKHPPRTEEYKKLRSQVMMGNTNGLGWKAPLEFRLKQSQLHKGVLRSKDFCDKQSLRRRGVPVRKLTCPHCQKIGGCSNMVRFHFDNCKNR